MLVPYQYRRMFRDLLDLVGLNLYEKEPIFERGFWVGRGKEKVFVSAEALAGIAGAEPVPAKDDGKYPYSVPEDEALDPEEVEALEAGEPLPPKKKK